MPIATDRQSWLAWTLTAAGVALFAANLYGDRFFFHDDAFISLRYALNLVTEGDLSWNPGDRVEGYTNFQHLVVVAGLMALGVSGVAAAQALNAVAAVALVAAVVVGARHMAPAQPAARAAAIAATLGATSLAAWLVGGLEMVLAAALQAWGLVLLLPLLGPRPPAGHARAVAAGIGFALAYLTRPDALLTAAVAGCAVLALGRRPARLRVADFLIIGAIPAAVLAAHVAWRYGYYGELLPNTYHAKVGVPLEARLELVPRYLLAAALVYMPAIALALVAAAGLALARRWSRQAALLLLCIVAYGAYVAWSGGDHMPAGRVLLPLLAPAALLLAGGLAAATPPWRQRLAVGAVALVAAAAWSAGSRKTDEAVYIGRVVARHIKEVWPAGAVVALHTAGSIPFLAPDHTYIDMLGLNDRHIGKRRDIPMLAPYQINAGHAKGDGAYVLARQPDYVIAGPAEGGPIEDPWFLSDVELDRLPEFHRCYALRRVELPYDVPPAARWEKIANPLVFTYYKRIC